MLDRETAEDPHDETQDNLRARRAAGTAGDWLREQGCRWSGPYERRDLEESE